MAFSQDLHRRDCITSEVPENLTQASAEAYIHQLQTQRPISDGQIRMLKRYKVNDDDFPELFSEASKLIKDVELKKNGSPYQKV